MIARYRACLVDDELAQLTLWEPVDDAGRVAWSEVFVKRPVRVTRFLIHEVALDLLTIRLIDVPLIVGRGDTASMVITPLMPSTCGPGCPGCGARITLAAAADLSGLYTAPPGHEVHRAEDGTIVFDHCPYG